MVRSQGFLDAVAPATRAALSAVRDLDAVLDEHVTAAHAAWPDVVLSDDSFLAHLARRLPDAAGEAELRAIRASDVYLACACACGDAEAIARFERTYFGEIDAAAARCRAGDVLASEARQIMRRILFVAEEKRSAAVAEFSGRGDLRGWIRVIAIRELVALLRRERRDIPIGDQELLDVLSPALDPELAYIRELYREDCVAAFRAAFEALAPKDRSLLRYQLIDGLSIDQIGALHAVHRATAARWIAKIREDLLERTRVEVQKRLGITPGEVDSILRLVRSRLDISFERILRDDGGDR